jgi:hypothetical protein
MLSINLISACLPPPFLLIWGMLLVHPITLPSLSIPMAATFALQKDLLAFLRSRDFRSLHFMFVY